MTGEEIVAACFETAVSLAEAVEATGLKRRWVKRTAEQYRNLRFRAFDNTSVMGFDGPPAVINNVFDRLPEKFSGCIHPGFGNDQSWLFLKGHCDKPSDK